MKKIYLVTGAAGHLGNNIVRQLCARGDAVRALVLPSETHLEMIDPSAQICRGDICQPDTIRPYFSHAEDELLYVIHCAGIVTIASKFSQVVWDVNVGGTQNIVDLCIEYHVEKLVYVSSVHAIPEQPDRKVITEITDFDPANVRGLYAQTKAAASKIVMDAAESGKLNASLVHPSGIVGPNDYGHGHITQLVIEYAKGKMRAGTTGGYDFVDVRDVASGIIACCDQGQTHQGYLLTNRYFSVADLFDRLYHITGLHKVSLMMPRWVAEVGAPFCGVYYKLAHQTPLFTSYSIYTLNSNSNFSHRKADSALGYTTRSFVQTLADTVASLRQLGRI